MIDGYRATRTSGSIPRCCPPLYVAYNDDVSEPTEVFHNDIRGRFDRGEPAVVDGHARLRRTGGARPRRRCWPATSTPARRARWTRTSTPGGAIFNLPPWQMEMVETARRCGASAKFAGSGGAIVGLYRDTATLERLRGALSAIHCRLVVPIVG